MRVNFFIGSWWKTNQSMTEAAVSVSERERETSRGWPRREMACVAGLPAPELHGIGGPASYRLTAQPRGGD